MKTFPNKCPACGHEDRSWEEPVFERHGEGELTSVSQTGTAKRFLRWYFEGSSPNLVGHCTRCKTHPYQHELVVVKAELNRAQIELDLALFHLRKIRDKAEAGASCLMCGEDFSDNTMREFPECPLPEVSEFLDDEERKGLVEAIERAAASK